MAVLIAGVPHSLQASFAIIIRRPIILAVVVAAVVSASAKQASAVVLNPTHWAVVDALKGEWLDFDGRSTWLITNTCEEMQGITCNADGYITDIDLSYKTLSSSIPVAIARLETLQYLDVHNCSLSGSIPSSLGSLTRLKKLAAHMNALSGSIPASLGDMASLQYLKLSANELSGSLPASLDRLSNLAALDLSWNQLEGQIPTEIGSFPVLQDLRLNNNRFSGPVPYTIGSIRTLRTLQLSDNELSGPLPPTLGSLTSLDQLFLSNNQLSGDLPATIGNIPFIITIDLSYNLFSSSLPSQWSSLSVLRKLHFHHTLLSGALPAAIGSMTNLRDLRMCCNMLTGFLPSQIGLLTKLTHLDLSSNRFFGPLPATLSALQLATAILLRDNQLNGTILPKPSAAVRQYQLDTNFFSAWFPYGPSSCAGVTLWANCLPVPTVFSVPPGYLCPVDSLPEGAYRQRSAAACAAFCGLWVGPESAVVERVVCGGHGSCYFDGPNRVPTCVCDAGYLNGEDPGTCVDTGVDPNAVSLNSKEHHKSMITYGKAFMESDDGAITLTPSLPSVWGAALLSTPIRLFSFDVKAAEAGRQLGFNAAFSFRLSGEDGNGTSGFAFVISANGVPESGGPGATGVTDLGYAGLDARSVAVEFDTRKDAASNDPSNNHVGVDVAGSTTSLATATLPPSLTLNDGEEKQAWVTYSPLKGGVLEIFLTTAAAAAKYGRPAVPVLSVKIALWKVLKPGVSPAVSDSYFFGFVGASEQPPQEQTILSWSVVTGFPSHQITTGFPLGLVLESKHLATAPVNPFFRYASVGYQAPLGDSTPSLLGGGGAAVQEESWVVSASQSWLQPSLHWELRDQGTCGDCWAYGVVQSIEAAYAILHNRSAPLLSVEQLRRDVGADCSGGSPFVAFQYLTFLGKAGKGLLEESQFVPASGHSAWGKGAAGGGRRVPFFERLKRALLRWRSSGKKKGKNKAKKGLRIIGFERTSFYGWFGLLLAVQRQPVVVHIEASADTFVNYDGFAKYQDPACFTYNLNHVVLLVGYRLVGADEAFPHMAPPFWIIRNSWGPDWGDGGHMRMDIQGGDGVCGINTLPGLYPVVKNFNDPCNGAGTAAAGGGGAGGGGYGNGIGALLNPCGGFPCVRDGARNKCQCTLPFVQATNADGSRTCAYVDVCGSSNGNPCAVGTCVNDGAGSYSCVCPPGFRQGTTVDGTFSCAPGSTNGSYTVMADGMTCTDMHGMYGLTLAQFQAQNKHVNCDNPLPRNTRLNVTSSLPLCSVFYTAVQGDTCLSVATYFSLDDSCIPVGHPCEAAFQALNPGVDCTSNSGALSPSQVVCVERDSSPPAGGGGDGGGGDAMVPVCTQTYMVQGGETCEALRNVPSPPLSRLNFYRLNPGINCDKLVPPNGVGATTGFEVCIQSASSYRAGSCPRSNFHIVVNNDRCGTIQFKYFKGIKSCYKRINGYDCLDKLKQGTRICLPDPVKMKRGRCSI